jgi:Holliday junction resolvase RusA-like endonuclease
MPSEAFEYWRRLAMEEALVIKGQLQRRGIELPIIDHVSVRALFYQDVDRADACGLYQGLGDFLQDAGILKNDRQIADWDGSRRLVDRADPRIEIFIQVVKRVPAEQDLLAGIGAQEG